MTFKPMILGRSQFRQLKSRPQPRFDLSGANLDMSDPVASPLPVTAGPQINAAVAASATVTWAIAAVMVALRFYTRSKIVHALGVEDWLLVAALVSLPVPLRIRRLPWASNQADVVYCEGLLSGTQHRRSRW